MEEVKKTKNSMAKKLCAICNIRVDQSSMEQHLQGKKHMSVITQLKIKKKRDEEASSEGIYVTGIPTSMSTSALLKHFERFGKVVAIQRYDTDNKALLQFKTRKHAHAALKSSHHIEELKSPHHVEESVLEVQPRSAKQHPTTTRKDGPVSHIEILKKELKESLMPNCKMAVDEQILSLVTALQVTEEEKRLQSQIISTLEEWLSLEFPSCRLQLFGSSVSGLAFRDESDLDIFMEIPTSIPFEREPASSQEQSLGKQRQNVVDVLRRASYVIRTHPDISDMFVVSSARIPVLKFVHVPTGIKCDITCNNIIGVQNSKLLSSLQSLDVRIRPYMYALKFWAKSHRLTSSPESTLSSYALSLMALYYLQQIEPPLVPSIESLQSAVSEEERMYCNGWNISYKLSPIAGTLPVETGHELTIMDLLIGFFRYYRSLNASEMVVCPRLGKLVPKVEFNDSTVDVEEKSIVSANDEIRDKPPLKLSLLTVQDPFELDFNVCFSFRHFELFQSLCELAEHTCLKICDAKNRANLLALFHSPVKTKLSPKVFEPPVQSSVFLKFTSLNDGATSEDAIKLCQSVSQFIGSLFNFSYGIQCEENTRIKSKQRKVDSKPSVPDENGSLLKWRTNYVMTVPFNVCSYKRDELTSQVVNDSDAKSLLDREKAITSLLSCHSPENVTPYAVVHFNICCDLDPLVVALHFENAATPKAIFLTLVKDIRRCVSKSVEEYLSENKLQYKLK